MKITVLNGSPRGEKSNTLKLTDSFLEGLKNSNENHIVKMHDISKSEINHCIGCFSCWTKTPGVCIFKDDMEKIIEDYISSDFVIWSLPLYYHSMPSKIKAVMDRLLPINLPFMDEKRNGGASYIQRYDLSKQKYLLVTTCGFHASLNNYEALEKQFTTLYGDSLEIIKCTEGELFSVNELKSRTDWYLNIVKRCGKEYGENLYISQERKNELSELLFPKEQFIEMANNSWNIVEEKKNLSRDLNFMKQMGAAFNKEEYRKKSDTILEFIFEDIKKQYQLKLNQSGAELITEKFSDYSMQIKSDFETWKKISSGELNGAKALYEKKYSISGDASILQDMGKYYGYNSGKSDSYTQNKRKKSNLFLFLLPWIIFWVLSPFNLVSAGIFTMLVSSFIPLLWKKIEITPFEKMNSFLLVIVGLMGIYLNKYAGVVSYMLLATVWIIGSFIKTPISAYYSINNYEDKSFMENPFFLKTNRVIGILWGIVFLVMGGLTLYSIKVENNSFNMWVFALPPIMGIFTGIFLKKYPIYLMKK